MKARDVSVGLRVEVLREQLHYDPKTGVFTWKVNKPGKHAQKGNRAGRQREDGYRDLRLNGHLYLEHRLAWFYQKGVWPEAMIDHKNGVRSENRWLNLRPATKSQNQTNQLGHAGRMRPYTGVGKVLRANGDAVWRATVTKDFVIHHLGYFDTPEDAYIARVIGELRLYGPHAGCLRPVSV